MNDIVRKEPVHYIAGTLRRLLTALAILSVSAALPCPAAESPDAADIVGTVGDALEHLQTLQCSFEKLYYRSSDERTIIQRGSLAIREPSFFRYQDNSKLVVVDGTNVWLYVPGNNQVQISEFLAGDETFPTPKSIFEQYAESRKADYRGEETVDGRELERLELPPPNPGEASVTVWIDRELRFPVMTLEKYPNGDTVQYILRDLSLNRPLADSLFVFTPPAGAEVLDMRE